METIKIKDKEFELFIPSSEIEQAIDRIAEKMTKDLEKKNPLFICVLNGSFMFASDLMKRINIPAEISFVRMSSYSGTASTGDVKIVYGLEESIEGRTIVVVEDIVDTGNTMERMLRQLEALNPKEIKVSTFLLKPDALKHEVPLDYVALSVPTDFIVGYGLDYDGYGRNLPDIYKLKQ
ncbi:hypoxanthine phosphoribosyltransferase [Dysgonomonas sp. 25]|uniref:hypoxanthine phosphoribosyltransferase n=1 Tax=Dysgonomonas sp. 25 TaxID=2302933 RepID=UPI0013D270DB|nr:hypoxanthine phosphoribosyltransferase [Dysgonomonas sp. 25]NDV70050.1 hypoxanthine phosphoribosyltransferase [Dysgonomonas sp. 25]